MDKTAKAKELIRYAEEILMVSEEFFDRTKRLVKTDDRYYFIDMENGECTRIVELVEAQ